MLILLPNKKLSVHLVTEHNTYVMVVSYSYDPKTKDKDVVSWLCVDIDPFDLEKMDLMPCN